MDTNRINFDVVRLILADTVTTLSELDGMEWDDSGKNSTERAVLSKRLNHAADMLTLASALVRNEYWVGKGFTDPTAEGDTDG